MDAVLQDRLHVPAGRAPRPAFGGGICYLAGTRVLTPRGEIAVESLGLGDALIAESGLRKVTWLDQRRVLVETHPQPEAIRPVRIVAGAFAPDLPRRDLFVAPDHLLRLPSDVSLGGTALLIPAIRLVNNATIRQEAGASLVHYVRLELDLPDLPVSEGVPALTSRSVQHRGLAVLQGQVQPRPPGRIVVQDGPLLAESYGRLLDRARAMGWHVARETDLRLGVAGRALRPSLVNGAMHRFDLRPADFRPDQPLRILSRSGPPILGPGAFETRRLGVCIGGLTFSAGSLRLSIGLDMPALRDGFHRPERLDGALCRWTDGDAQLPGALFGRPTGPAMLEITLAATAERWEPPEAAEARPRLRIA